MLFDHNEYSSPLLLGFVHAVLFAVVFWAKGRRDGSLADRLMAAYLLLSAFGLGPYMLGFAGWYSSENPGLKRFMYYVPMLQGLAVAPLHFLYVRAVTDERFRLKRRDGWHFFPAILWSGAHLAVFVFDFFFNEKRWVDHQIATAGDSDYDRFYLAACFVSTAIYFTLAFKIWRAYEKNVFETTSVADSIRQVWLRNFNRATLAVAVAFFFFQWAGAALGWKYVDEFWFYLAQVALLFYLTVAGYAASVEAAASAAFSPKRKAEIVGEDANNGQKRAEIEPFLIEKAATEKAQPDRSEDPEWLAALEVWKPKIEKAMNEDRLFLEPELSLADLAAKLKTNPSLVSRAINQGFGQNFNDFVNSFRVAEFERKKADPGCGHLSLMGLAFESGFNSKATFNRVFRKLRGRAPSEI